MDENKSKALQAALAQIEKQFGKGSIMRLGNKDVLVPVSVIPTGAASLDAALGVGGVPLGPVRLDVNAFSRKATDVADDEIRLTAEVLAGFRDDYPDVDVVLVHMDNPVSSIFLAKRCPNVYLETSWVERKWANLAPVKLALDCVAPHQILFGTDFPYEFPLPEHLERIGAPRSYEAIVELYQELLPADAARRIIFLRRP